MGGKTSALRRWVRELRAADYDAWLNRPLPELKIAMEWNGTNYYEVPDDEPDPRLAFYAETFYRVER